MGAFHAVASGRRYRTLDLFGRAVRERIDRDPMLRLVSAPSVVRLSEDGAERWDALPTVFTFLVVLRGARARPLSVAEAKLVYRWLNEDMSPRLWFGARRADRALAATKCHIGQPVAWQLGHGRTAGALRLAAGARLVSGVQFDNDLGNTEDERLQMESRNALTVFNKISFIAEHWERLQTL